MAKSKKTAAREGNGEETRKPRKPRGPVVRIDSETFVRLWVARKSVSEIAEAVGASISCVRAKAMTLRKKGVNLPRAPTGRTTAGEIEYLNSIIQAAGDGYVQESLPLDGDGDEDEDVNLNQDESGPGAEYQT